jgi:hypothetical protein
MVNPAQADNYNNENWVVLYRAALIELEHARMSDRIKDARIEIVARIEKLHTMPGLHTEERDAIADALSALRSLEQEETHFDAEQKCRALDKALETLLSRDSRNPEDPERESRVASLRATKPDAEQTKDKPQKS